jgi:hypothetical protein
VRRLFEYPEILQKDASIAAAALLVTYIKIDKNTE